MQYKKLDVIEEALTIHKRMPFCLEQENERIFQEQLEKTFELLSLTGNNVLSINQEKETIDEQEWKTKTLGGFFMSLFYHWLSITKDIKVCFVQAKNLLDEDFVLPTQPKVLYVGVIEKLGNIKRDECMLNVNNHHIQEFFSWMGQEMLHCGNFGDFYRQYFALETFPRNEVHHDPQPTAQHTELCELDEVDNEFIADLHGIEYEMEDDDNEYVVSYQESLRKMEDSIKRIFKQNAGQTSSDDDEEGCQATEQEVHKVDFYWNGHKVHLSFPIDVSHDLNNGAIDINWFVTNPEELSWLEQQNSEVQQTLVALWGDFVFSKLSMREPIRLSWVDLRQHLISWLRKDCAVNLKKIETKFKNTIQKIFSSERIGNFSFTTEINDFFKIILYIEKQAATALGKSCLIDVTNVAPQYFYAFNQEHVLLEFWGSIIYEKLIKDTAKHTTSEQFDELKEKFPNFKEIIEYFCGAMHIFEQTGIPPAPVLLLGSPGLGKTHFAGALSKLIGSQMLALPVSSLTAGWIISGSSAQWKDANMGKVASTLLNGKSMSPVLVLDEIDKKSDSNYDPLGALYPLLENHTATSFIDEYLEFPIDASKVVWIATANNLNSIPEPILDRFVIFDVPQLSQEQTKLVIHNIFAELTQALNVENLSNEMIDLLKDKTPRQIKQVLKKGLAYAASERLNTIELKHKHLDLHQRTKRIGFN